ncbi:hypothetical protein BD309DRAFT_824985, partial [Dichomitus squalens]
LSDVIVWWRVYAIWGGNRFITVLGLIVLLPSIELGAGSLFINSIWGLMGDLLSVTFVNLLATALITYKAWEHRRFVHDYLRAASCRSPAEKVLFLLVESGVAYCLIWVSLDS